MSQIATAGHKNDRRRDRFTIIYYSILWLDLAQRKLTISGKLQNTVIAAIMMQLHWLSSSEHIMHSQADLVYKSMNGLALDYLYHMYLICLHCIHDLGCSRVSGYSSANTPIVHICQNVSFQQCVL